MGDLRAWGAALDADRSGVAFILAVFELAAAVVAVVLVDNESEDARIIMGRRSRRRCRRGHLVSLLVDTLDVPAAVLFVPAEAVAGLDLLVVSDGFRDGSRVVVADFCRCFGGIQWHIPTAYANGMLVKLSVYAN